MGFTSAHSYGFREEDMIAVGEIEGVFAGTFISTTGESLAVARGEFRIQEALPDGAVVK